MGTWDTTRLRGLWPIGVIVLVALVLRGSAALRLTAHIDEASSVLAMHRVAETGLPILPSGSTYFQGATLSYLLAPLAWFGWADLDDDLGLLRLPAVIAGTVAVWLTYQLGMRVSGSARVGGFAALFLALDPISIQWSAHARMYAPLQALSLGLMLTFLHLLTMPPRRRRLLLFVALWWVAIFTHITAALLLPAMGLIAFRAHGRNLFGERRHLTLGLCLGATSVVALLGLNASFGQARAGTNATAGLPWIHFV
ncbi:MAG: glycosyltransferase family 39 protein, partial [Chloroflexota bacterium]|nr:glycosyltransferase family 39 protein [Chloroflexota bacterium]